jgi:hypothetical protein
MKPSAKRAVLAFGIAAVLASALAVAELTPTAQRDGQAAIPPADPAQDEPAFPYPVAGGWEQLFMPHGR